MFTRLYPFLTAFAVAAAFGSASAHAACEANVLADPGFEAGDLSLHWDEDASGGLGHFLHTDGDLGIPAAGGNHALRFYPRMTADVLGVGQALTVSPGAYTLSFDWLLTGENMAGSLFIRVNHSEQHVLPLDHERKAAAYSRVVLPLEIPASDSPVVISIWNPSLSGGHIVIDNVCLEAATTPPGCPVNLVHDAGFEAGNLEEFWGFMGSGSLQEMLYDEQDGPWPVADGRFALRFYARMTDDVLSVGQVIEVEGGTDYVLAFDLLITTPDSNGALAVSLDGEWLEHISLDELPFTGGFQRVEMLLPASGEAGPVVFSIENPFLDGGDILLDNICLTPLDDEPPVINAVHVQLAINGALGLEVPQWFNPDVNGDGKVDAVDVQLIINAALGVSLNP